MKKFLSIFIVALLVASSTPLIAKAETTVNGYYIYTTGYVNRSTGNCYGFIGNKSGPTPGTVKTVARIIDSKGLKVAYDEGAWWSEVSASVKPGYPGSRVETHTYDERAWSHFIYN